VSEVVHAAVKQGIVDEYAVGALINDIMTLIEIDRERSADEEIPSVRGET